MPSRRVIVRSASGLHARPAATFTKAAAGSGLHPTIAADGRGPVDAASILAVMSLGVRHGDAVELSAEGPDADGVLDRLVDLLSRDLDAAG